MKYQVNVLIEVLKKSMKFIIFFYIMVGIDAIVFLSQNNLSEDICAKVLSVILIPTIENIRVINPLIVFYNLILIIYIIISYILYEKNHSYKNIAMRFESKKYFISKISLIMIFLIFYSIFYFSYLTLFFSSSSIEWKYILQFILYTALILMTAFSIFNTRRCNKIIMLILFVIFILCTLYFYPLLITLYLLILVGANYKSFNIRLLFNE